MEIDRRITNIWTITVDEAEVYNRITDESIQEGARRSAGNVPSIVVSDRDKPLLHRYYCESLAELSALLARRTTRVGGSIVNNTNPTTKMITTVFTLAMTDNHESVLLPALTSHCLEFLIARVLEKWYGHGADYGANYERGEIRSVLHYRREPIERPQRPL